MPISTKQIYCDLCAEKALPLFMQAWWMDAVCGSENWDVCLSEKHGRIVGALPYLLVKKFCFKLVIQPQLTQFNGIWINYTYGMQEDEQRIFEKEVEADLIHQIDKLGVHYFNQNLHYFYHNTSLFTHNGFDVKTRYTYVIEDISNLNKVFSTFSYAKQKHIKKSEVELMVDFGMDANSFYQFHVACLKQKGEKILYSSELFLSIFKASVARNAGQIISIKDKDGNMHAALFILWDKNSSYNLISAIDSKYKSGGASTLMVWEAIKFVSDKTRVFDFEGSMIESVANSFKQFGTIRKTYFNVSKYYSGLFKQLMRIRSKA